MLNILVLYYSRGGSTRKLAQLIARGIEEQGAEAVLRCVPEISTTSDATDRPKHAPRQQNTNTTWSSTEYKTKCVMICIFNYRYQCF